MCPLCALAIAADRPVVDAGLDRERACDRCGLWWSRTRHASAFGSAGDSPASPFAHRASNLFALAFVAASLLGIAAAAASSAFEFAADRPGVRTVVWAVVDAVIGIGSLVIGLRMLVDVTARAIVAERVERDADVVLVRVRSRWARRSDARVPRSMIREVVLVPWQLGTQEVWVVVDGDHMFRLAEAMSPESAQRRANAVAAAIHGREPIPRARFVRRSSKHPH